ncbi:alpha-(1,3)-fucosyltransferase C-like [Battus philenor]|uniref:alpha-(1,3)-fucosyltransferase C-like n=1 Tax=Battus philenor TaxID=42288 RepID=UPI0035CEA75C
MLPSGGRGAQCGAVRAARLSLGAGRRRPIPARCLRAAVVGINKKAFKINKISIRNMLMLLSMVSLTMGFHVWIVCKTLSLLNDVTDIIVINHNKQLVKSWPDVNTYILNWDKHLDTKTNQYECCALPNCMITKEKENLEKDYKMFDAILYSERFLESKNRPANNINRLKVFTSNLPYFNKVVCDQFYDNYFNLTFTYRLDSDIVLKNFVVRNLSEDIIAPNLDPKWNISFDPVSKKIKSIIVHKSKPIAYIRSHCEIDDWKKSYLDKLEAYLPQHSLKLNIFNSSNNCGNELCGIILKNEYYFFIIFEDYFAEDYLTEKILKAYDNFVVPIIFSGVNYSRFLPPNSYINGLEKSSDIAATISESLNNYTHYEKYFQWRNMYTIESYQPFCDLCNTVNRRVNTPAKKNFRQWWNGMSGMQSCSLPQFNNNTT